MHPSDSKRRLAAIMFTDIVGYSALMSRDEETALRVVGKNAAIHKQLINHFEGTLLKELGDGVLAYFESPTNAVHCAAALHAAVQNEAFSLRIGIHQGEIMMQGGDIFGDGVNIASRIEALAEPGQTLISTNVLQSIQNKPGISTQKIGERHIKGFAEPMTLYSVVSGREVPALATALEQPAAQPVGGRARMRVFGLLGIAAVIVTLIVLLRPFEEDASPPAISERVPEDQNIAVLPLFNLDDTQEDQAYFSRGMTNEIIDELTKIRSFLVASFSSIIRYENYPTMDKSLRDIAAELGVRYLVAGSTQIYSENDSFTLSIELIEPEESLQRIWHQKYTESMRDIVRIQSGIARNIAQSLNIELSDAELRDLGTLNTVSGEATRLLYEAESEFAKLNGAGFNRAIELLKQALDLDPNYAQAHTFMAWTYNQSGLTFYQDAINRPTRQTTTLFNQHAERALELDPLSSDLYMVRANFRLNHTGRLVDARNDVDRALKINSWPRIPTKYCVCTASTIYLLLGDLARAKELVEITSRVDPGNVFIDTEKAMIHLTEGRMTEAQSSMKVALTKTPIPFLNFLTGLTFYHDHQYQEALNYFLRAYHTEGRPIPHAVAYLANTHRQLGNASDALAFQKELEDRMAEGEHHLHYIFAMMKMAAGEHDEALDLLETAQAQQESALAYFLNLDPIFKPLYQDPRFIAIRSKMQFQQ